MTSGGNSFNNLPENHILRNASLDSWHQALCWKSSKPVLCHCSNL